MTIVLDAESHLLRVLVVKKHPIESPVVGVFIIFQRFNVGLVDMGTHSIANSVVSSNVVSFQVSYQEVVSEEIIVWVMGLEVHDTLIVILTILKDY